MKAAQKNNTENLEKLGFDVSLFEVHYKLLEAIREAVTAKTVNKQYLQALVKNYINIAENFIGAQKGLDNFSNDENKRNDPFLANIYIYWKQFSDRAQRLVTDHKFANEFFGQRTAGLYAEFLMEIKKVMDRA
jgi:hypothetical protein